MDKEAFRRSLKGTMRHLKRKVQTMDPVKKWTAIGAGVGGATGAGMQHLSNKATDKYGDAKDKEFRKKHKILTSPVLMGAATAAYGAAKFRDIGHTVKSFRNFAKATRRRRYGGKSREAPRSAPPKSSAPEWLRGVKTKAEAKAKHRAEAMKHHPDRGGSEEKMKKLNSDWDAYKAHHFNKLSHILPSLRSELERIRETSR